MSIKPTSSLSDDQQQAEILQRMGASIEDLNTRIARLAIALGISLKNNDEVTQAMSQLQAPPVPAERRSDALDRRAGARSEGSADRRLSYKRVELRGLLVLRYGLEMRYVEEVGVSVTRHLMTEAEAHLVRDGFAPGADGVDLTRLFDGA